MDLKPVWFYQDGFAAGDRGRRLRRRQPRDLVAGRSRRSGSWPVMAFGAGASRWRSSRSGSRPSGSRGLGSTAPPSSTTTTRRCRSSSSPSPTSSPSCGTAPRAGPGCWPVSPAAVAIVAPAVAVAASPAAVRVRRGRVGEPRLAGLPGGHPRARADAPDGRARDRRRGSALVLLVRAFLAFDSDEDDRAGRAGRRRPSRSLLLTGAWWSPSASSWPRNCRRRRS